jgi:hypothetical protein
VAAPPQLDEVLSVQPADLLAPDLEVLPWLLLRGYPEKAQPWLVKAVIGPEGAALVVRKESVLAELQESESGAGAWARLPVSR